MCPQVKIPIKWSVQVSAKDLREYLLAEERLKPVVFIVPAKHAEWLEFGSAPAQQSSNGDLQIAIRRWLQRKRGVSNPSELDRLTKQISGRIARYGLAPRPFFRPAFYYVSDNLQQLFDQGYSLMDIIQHMAERTNENIMWNRYAPPGSEYMPDTGTLQMGWIIRYLEPEEVENAKRETVDVNSVADRVWPGPRKRN